jgi:hypothetical protein
MTDIIESNFSQIKDILQEHQDKLIETITLKNQKEIAELKQIIEAKETQINNLKQKEGLL